MKFSVMPDARNVRQTCDRCRRRAEKNYLEFQAFLAIDHKAGYGSVFDDVSRLRLDLCQHCVNSDECTKGRLIKLWHVSSSLKADLNQGECIHETKSLQLLATLRPR